MSVSVPLKLPCAHRDPMWRLVLPLLLLPLAAAEPDLARSEPGRYVGTLVQGERDTEAEWPGFVHRVCTTDVRHKLLTLTLVDAGPTDVVRLDGPDWLHPGAPPAFATAHAPASLFVMDPNGSCDTFALEGLQVASRLGYVLEVEKCHAGGCLAG